MGLRLIEAPAQEPITLAEAKLAATEDGSAFDSAFSNIWIPTAREQVEFKTGQVMVTQTWLLTLDAFPSFCASGIKLPNPPLQAVNSVKYLNAAGDLVTLPGTEYEVVEDGLLAVIYPAFGKTWPSINKRPKAVQIEFIAGYASADEVPRSLKQWMLMAVATWYRQREGLVTGTIVADLPRDFFAGLLDLHRVPSL